MEENNLENPGISENSENTDTINNTTENNNYSDSGREISRYEFEQILKKERATGRGQGVLIMLAAMAVVFVISVLAYFTVKYVIYGNRDNLIVGAANNYVDFISDNAKSKAGKLWSLIGKKFLWDEDIDAERAEEYLYKGMIASLGDPYSVYYTKEEYNELIESFEGEYSGIGAYVSQNAETGETYISKPMPGSPAEEAGLMPDDRIMKVDGEPVDGLDLNVIVSKIKGPEGTTVDLEIYREGETDFLTLTIERRTIEIIRVEGKMLDNKLGYILITEIEDSTLDQFDTIFAELKSKGMKGLVLDLRDNPGGDLNVIVKLADKFLDEGIVVYTKDKYGKIEEFKSDAACVKIPMVVLVNGNTASAAEILSGSLKERGVARIIGTTTFGKGIVQAIYPLMDGSGIKITESEYFLEHDTKIHGIGVIPDIEVKFDREAYLEKGTDNQLDKATEVLKKEVK